MRGVFSLVMCGSALAVGACGSGSGGSGGPNAAQDKNLCGQLFDANVKCGILATSPADLMRQRGRFQTSCVAAMALPGTSETPSWVMACIAALDASGCDPTNPPPACQTAPGQLAASSPCIDDAQCQSSVCNLPQIDVNAAIVIGGCGTCATPIPVGSKCDGTTPCAAGSDCNFAPTPAVCQTRGDVGATCGGFYPSCRAGLTCHFASVADKTGTCARPASLGQSCASTTCVPGLVCGQSGNCETPKSWAAPGQPCNAFTPCQVGLCVFLGPSATDYYCSTVDPEGRGCSVTDPRPKSTCDSSTSCVNGVCTITDTQTCSGGDGG